MEIGGAWRFPSLTPRVSDLYGASGSFRVGEADAYAQELDKLEQEERALEDMVQSLVARQAPVPIGVKHHRDGDEGRLHLSLLSSGGGRHPNESALQYVDSPVVHRESSGEDEEDMEEDEMEEEVAGRSGVEEDQSTTFVREEEEEDTFARDDEVSSLGEDSMETDAPPPPEHW